MHVISVISTKGGEGKSTHSANLAGFCADAGLKTLLIDGDYAQPADPGRSCWPHESGGGQECHGLPAGESETGKGRAV